MFSRREFLILGTGAAALAIVPGTVRSGTANALPLPGGSASLDPTLVPKYVTALPRPATMPKTAVLPDGVDYYEIAVRQLQQQILPAQYGYGTTKVWGYGSLVDGQFRAISKTIEATAGVPVRVKWLNQLVDPNTGNFLPHILPVDPTIHWANPEGPIDSKPTFASTPPTYTGPVPMVSHVHGAHTGPESDGYAEAWWLPAANNLPAGITTKGSKYDQYDRSNTTPGSAVYHYPNTQRASAIWYHDHTLGMTRLNVYAGPAGFWMIRGGADDLPAGVLPAGQYEVPVVVQDRCFNVDGSLWYPDTRDFFDGFGADFPYFDSGIPPYWQPEFFANTMVVNGVTWPHLDVEPRRYRFRFLNGCGSRFLRLKLVAENPEGLAPDQLGPQPFAVDMNVIGTDGGFLPNVSVQPDLLMGPAERFDVIVDFSAWAGQTFYLVNEGPDEPFGGGVGGPTPDDPFAISDAFTTRQVMKITVGGSVTSVDTSTPIQGLQLPARAALPAPNSTRRVSLNEEALTLYDPPLDTLNGAIIFDGPIAAKLGTIGIVDGVPNMGMPMMWGEAPTETPLLGATEDWEICNFTMDAHPIHLHLVEFEVLGRSKMDVATGPLGALICQLPLNPTWYDPEPWETGLKDTVVAYPGEITKIRAHFDLPGLYQWHCHITEHEDNEMMRPMAVVSNPSVTQLGRLVESALVAAGGSTVNISSSQIDGLLSSGPKAPVALSGTTRVDALRAHTGVAVTRSAGVKVTNGVTKGNQSLLAAQLNGAGAAARLLPNASAMPAITASRIIIGAGLTVINVPSITLSGAARVLTLRGTADTEFVINVAGNIALSNGASIRLDGVLPSQVLINITGKGKLFSMSSSSAAGTFLNPGGSVSLSRSTVSGSVMAGGKVELSATALNRV